MNHPFGIYEREELIDLVADQIYTNGKPDWDIAQCHFRGKSIAQCKQAYQNYSRKRNCDEQNNVDVIINKYSQCQPIPWSTLKQKLPQLSMLSIISRVQSFNQADNINDIIRIIQSTFVTLE